MTRFAYPLALSIVFTACAADDPAGQAADQCPPEAEEVMAQFSGGSALHEAPDWTVEPTYAPIGCYGSPDCSVGGPDSFYFEAPEAGRYRFSTDLGDLYYARPCSDDPNAKATFDFEGFTEFEVELFAGEFIGLSSYQWTDSDPVGPPTYVVRVERLEAPEEEGSSVRQ